MTNRTNSFANYCKNIRSRRIKTEEAKLNTLKSQNTELKRKILNALSEWDQEEVILCKRWSRSKAYNRGGERGPEMFIPNSTGQITQSARGISEVDQQNNFNINTVDARGFEELLVRSRGNNSIN